MLSIMAVFDKNGISIVQHMKTGALNKSLMGAPKLNNSIYKYADNVLKSYPNKLQDVITKLNGKYAISSGEVFKSAGERILPNGDVYRFSRHLDQQGVECLTAELLRDGKTISTKQKYFVNGLAQVQEKTNFLTGEVKQTNFNTDKWKNGLTAIAENMQKAKG